MKKRGKKNGKRVRVGGGGEDDIPDEALTSKVLISGILKPRAAAVPGSRQLLVFIIRSQKKNNFWTLFCLFVKNLISHLPRFRTKRGKGKREKKKGGRKKPERKI